MKNTTKHSKNLIIIFILLIFFSTMIICYGNSAEPPSILLIVPNAPDDLKISMGSNRNVYEAKKIDKVIETYYAFYRYNMQLHNLSDSTLNITTGDESFEIHLDKPMKTYSNVYTLDLNNRNLKEGKLLSRSILLVTIRIILTLSIEAIVFFMFGFRRKNSWVLFIIINLITQGVLNIWINGFIPTISYPIFSLIFGEFFVFISEIAAFHIFVKEHNTLRTVLYVITANLISLIAGGYIITILPI